MIHKIRAIKSRSDLNRLRELFGVGNLIGGFFSTFSEKSIYFLKSINIFLHFGNFLVLVKALQNLRMIHLINCT